MHELQPAVNYRVAVLPRDSGSVINPRREAWFTKIPKELQICNFHLACNFRYKLYVRKFTSPSPDSPLSTDAASSFPPLCDSSHPFVRSPV